MPSTLRIPKADITGPYGALVRLFAKRMLGADMPDDAYVYFHQKKVLKAVLGFEGKVSRWDALDPPGCTRSATPQSWRAWTPWSRCPGDPVVGPRDQPRDTTYTILLT
jgi:hypothetical protein